MVWPQCQTWLGSWPQLPQWQLDTSCLNHLLIESSPPAPNYPGLPPVEVKFTHTKTDDCFLYILNLYCWKTRGHSLKLMTRSLDVVVHILLATLCSSPSSSRLLRPHPPPGCKLSSHTRFSLRYLFRVFKKKKTHHESATAHTVWFRCVEHKWLRVND